MSKSKNKGREKFDDKIEFWKRRKPNPKSWELERSNFDSDDDYWSHRSYLESLENALTTIDWYEPCFKRSCQGMIKGQALEDVTKDIVKFLWRRCDKCGFEQYG
jgi:hypothetical protein